jgi:ribonuclease BN (tRNA processing enzyme)
MDHIQGLGFFEPLFWPGLDVHLWGPSSTTYDLRSRLTRYLSPPLFPVRLRDLPCKLTFHNVVSEGGLSTGPFEVRAQLVCHPGPTVGYRIAADGASLAYLPDHEPALGALEFPGDRNWLSGIDLVEGVDLLIHDAQYTDEEYAHCVGWGHSSLVQLLTFARAARVRHLVPFHHDPAHSDVTLDELFAAARGASPVPFDLTPAADGLIFDLAGGKPPRGA